MKSIKNHLSLVIALLSILASIQIFIVADRAINAYKSNLADNYSVIVVAQKRLNRDEIIKISDLIADSSELSPDSVIQRLNSGMDKKNIELLKLTLPKFYKLRLYHYPSPAEIEHLTEELFKNSSISKVEDFSNTHDTIYKLLQLFKSVVTVFAVMILVVTTLLIFKELRIWQFQHSERMSIMGLFGAPIWLRSAVLFRLAIVDALISTLVAFITFNYLSSNQWIKEQFSTIGIEVVVFDPVDDCILLLGVAIVLSILLASLIVLGHKEEV